VDSGGSPPVFQRLRVIELLCIGLTRLEPRISVSECKMLFREAYQCTYIDDYPSVVSVQGSASRLLAITVKAFSILALS
jgi:hypothetical protein